MNEKIEKYEVFGGVPVPDDRYLTIGLSTQKSQGFCAHELLYTVSVSITVSTNE